MRTILRIWLLAASVLALPPPAFAWTWPVEGEILRPFALGDDVYAAGQHRGIDIAAGTGVAVRAPAAGRITYAGTLPRYGKTLTIRTDDGYAVTLLHLGSLGVKRDAVVAEGDTVGTVGPSGEAAHDVPYVYLGVRRWADEHGYVDPLLLLPAVTAVAVPVPVAVATGQTMVQTAAEPLAPVSGPPAEVRVQAPPPAGDPPRVQPAVSVDPGEPRTRPVGVDADVAAAPALPVPGAAVPVRTDSTAQARAARPSLRGAPAEPGRAATPTRALRDVMPAGRVAGRGRPVGEPIGSWPTSRHEQAGSAVVRSSLRTLPTPRASTPRAGRTERAEERRRGAPLVPGVPLAGAVGLLLAALVVCGRRRRLTATADNPAAAPCPLGPRPAARQACRVAGPFGPEAPCVPRLRAAAMTERPRPRPRRARAPAN